MRTKWRRLPLYYSAGIVVLAHTGIIDGPRLYYTLNTELCLQHIVRRITYLQAVGLFIGRGVSHSYRTPRFLG